MKNVEKQRAQLKELEAVLAGRKPTGDIFENEAMEEETEAQPGQMAKPDRNMTVCEVCGALQSAADCDQRLQMHLEGKLH